MATVEHRTGPELIYAIADQIRAGRDMEQAILRALHGEHHDRYVNLVADLAEELHCEQLSKWDVDRFADEHSDDPLRHKDHPGAYAMRLNIWAARIGSPQLVAVALDTVADRMADNLPDFITLRGAL